MTTLDIDAGIRSLAAYQAKARYVPDGAPGGYRAAEHVFKNMQPGEVIDTVKAAGLRGKGGAGFPAGLKWSFVPKDHPGPKYLAINADEGEPGTFKDRFILEDCPHRLIEGAMIACYAFGAHQAYCYIRGEFYDSIRLLDEAAKEAYAAGILGDKPFGVDYPMHFQVHTGAGAYICGEETSMLSSLMGERGHPRMKPPFPAVEGLWRKPTVINNVETIATVRRDHRRRRAVVHRARHGEVPRRESGQRQRLRAQPRLVGDRVRRADERDHQRAGGRAQARAQAQGDHPRRIELPAAARRTSSTRRSTMRACPWRGRCWARRR